VKQFSEEWWQYYLSGRGELSQLYHPEKLVYSEMTVRHIICQILNDQADNQQEGGDDDARKIF
jgi:hypothetical protein